MGFQLYDLDGCVTPVSGAAMCPSEPCDDLAHFMREHNAPRVIVTGQPLQVALQVPKMLGVKFQLICPDYGSGLFTPDGQQIATTIPAEQVRALEQARAPLITIVSECFGGILDGDRGAIFSLNFFWHDAGSFEAAQRAITDMDSVMRLIRPSSTQALLRMQWNPSDWSMNVLPASACKGNAVLWLQQRGFQIELAAGDSRSDIPMLNAARFPIATHTGVGGVEQALRQIVSPRGFVAPDDKPHGYGLLAGLLHHQHSAAAL